VPPLLRGFAPALGNELAKAMPLDELKPSPTVLGPLTVSGITSIGALLAHPPDQLYETVLGKSDAGGLSALVTSAEAKAGEVAKAVAEALKAAASEHQLVSTADLETAGARSALGRRLAAALHLRPAAATAAVTAALA
jgi:hypothetical protein